MIRVTKAGTHSLPAHPVHPVRLKEAAGRLLEKVPGEWNYQDLDMCGEILRRKIVTPAEEKELYRKLVVDPYAVKELAGFETEEILSESTETNWSLCDNLATAFLVNRAYWLPMQKRDPDTILDFAVVAWEYLQEKAFRTGPRNIRFSMRTILIAAARPNGWIGQNSMFSSGDRKHADYVRRKGAVPYLVESGLSIDDISEDGYSLLDQFSEQVFKSPGDFTEHLAAKDLLERVGRRMKQTHPAEEAGLYISLCLIEEHPIHVPSKYIRDLVKGMMEEAGKPMTESEILRWFHRYYRSFTRAVKKEAEAADLPDTL